MKITAQKLPDIGSDPVGKFEFSDIPSIADLRAINTGRGPSGINLPNLTHGSVANVTGYYTQNDGGGGVFIFDAYSIATDDGGITIAPSEGLGRWVRQTFSAPVSVKWFGAKGDNAQDDTTYIQNTVDYLTVNIVTSSLLSYGGVVFFPAGVYKTTAEISVVTNGVVLCGETVGISALNIAHAGTGIHFLPNAGIPLSIIRSVGVRNLRFQSSVENRDAGSMSIHMETAAQFTVENVYIQSKQETAIFIENSLDGIISRCRLDAPGGSDAFNYGIRMIPGATTGPNQITVDNCWIENSVVAHIAVEGDANFSSNLVTIRETLMQGGDNNGIEFIRCNILRIVGCWFEANGRAQTASKAAIRDMSVNVNRQSHGIFIEQNVLGGNDDAHASFEHVKIEHATRITIRDCYISDGTGSFSIADTTTFGLEISGNWAVTANPTMNELSNDKKLFDNYIASAGAPWTNSAQPTPSSEGTAVIATDQDVTPTANPKISLLYLENTIATEITSIDDGYDGQRITLVGVNGNTTIKHSAGNIRLNGAADFAMGANDTLTLIKEGRLGARWLEIGRSNV